MTFEVDLEGQGEVLRAQQAREGIPASSKALGYKSGWCSLKRYNDCNGRSGSDGSY